MDLIIIGTGGHGRELAYLVQDIEEFNFIGFVDDKYENDTCKIQISGKPILGNVQSLINWSRPVALVIGIAYPEVREKIYTELKNNPLLSFPNLISDKALVGNNIQLGIGNILMPGATLINDIELGNFNMVQVGTMIGHDSTIGDYNAIFPSVNISGFINMGNKNEIGVGTKIIPGIEVGNSSIVGAGSVVIHDIKSGTKNVGVPTRVIGYI
ncbi:acetyltransferase [Enterococcus faecalis]|uniref:Sugar O-acyltransferase, sialic acid O-acetyltransferase NeuD family n=1 Tax=Enterococcus faecalis RP2S-4 TaxID=1244145 RepID=A0ABC9TP64_ENTFL|nr:NeuD/PglB/VioB family sugar acetyltransferase [Enterococcus faecalis]EPI12580.1 sugar O-acyltransferase, sialic acid O-acetyltransferase NeuD family [Enterococcus faecalis RP2S-4]